jgi:glucose/arabinose dehydrogenase
MTVILRAAILAMLAPVFAGCDSSALTDAATEGPNPTIPAPSEAPIPAINIARAVGWPEGAAPKPAEGLAVNAFAKGLDHPRWLLVLPNGDVLVAETNTPKQEGAGGFSLKQWLMGKAMSLAGAGVPSPNRIVLLRDADSDGWPRR